MYNFVEWVLENENKNYKSESVFPFNCSLKKKKNHRRAMVYNSNYVRVRLSQTQQNKDFNFKKDSQFSWS